MLSIPLLTPDVLRTMAEQTPTVAAVTRLQGNLLRLVQVIERLKRGEPVSAFEGGDGMAAVSRRLSEAEGALEALCEALCRDLAPEHVLERPATFDDVATAAALRLSRLPSPGEPTR